MGFGLRSVNFAVGVFLASGFVHQPSLLADEEK